MLKQTSHTLIIVLLAILLPSALSFPYSIYGMKNYRRAQRASNNQLSMSSAPRQRYDQQGYRAPSSQQAAAPSSASSYYGNYDSLYDTGADNYYVDDEPEEARPEREYLYGRPTYHGEYKPTRYYYARAPSYNNYYNDHSEPTNPLDDLHEEMLQEEQHERQRNWPAGKTSWFQNTGQPKSLTSNFMKNLMLYNNGINVDQARAQPQPMDMDNVYDDEENVDSPYGGDGDISNQNEPYDYFDPLKYQSTNQFNRFDSSAVNKQTYFNQDNRNENNDYYTPTKNHKQTDYDTNDKNSHEDKEEKDLESLRTNQHNKNSWDRNDGEKQQQSINDGSTNKHSENTAYNGGYDTGFDYDEDEWINWDRKRSLPKKQNENLRPLKVLEYQLTRALQEQTDTLPISTTTTTVVPPTTSTTSTTTTTASSTNKVHEHKGQKEVVLSRPATPLRRHFSDSVLDALTKTTNEMKQPNQNDADKPDTQENGKQQHSNNHSMGNKKHKRFVSSETSLVQQLNGLKRKIKA